MIDGFIDERNVEIFLTSIKAITKKIWVKPESILEEVKIEYKNIFKTDYEEITISGETDNITIYVIIKDYLLAIMPFTDLRENVLLLNWNKNWAENISNSINYHFFKLDNNLRELLNMPKVLLINLCVIENFPIPRLNLSTGVIASYLRKKQCANVSIIDMQVGTTLSDIIQEFNRIQPDITGISVFFGQKELAFSLLRELFLNNTKSVITVGNIIPALYPEEFINLFPKLIVSYGEGESTMPDLLGYIKGNLPLKNVKGIIYKDSFSNMLLKTESEAIDLSEVPTPALDTIQDISKLRGSLTLETTRGCAYSKCTFCSRQLKLGRRYQSPAQTLTQIDNLILAGNAVGINPHISLRDEEFIGESHNDKESNRIIDIYKGLISRNNIKFDTSARADSVYDNKRTKEWNVERIEMWNLCKLAGLDRLFVGVESGSNKQLNRYGKGTTVDQNIIALRILTSLGIDIRIGFIMFDPLMIGVNDLKENLAFLERTDVIMNPIDTSNMSYEQLYEHLVYDDDFIKQNSKGHPVYSLVSYMLASLEVLIGSNYIKMIHNAEKKHNVNLTLNNGNPDSNMGRYIVKYIDPIVGCLSISSQKWIDSNFSIMYTIKSLCKCEDASIKHVLYEYMVRYREISHFLLKYIIYNLEPSLKMDKSLLDFINRVNFPEKFIIEAQNNNNLDINDKVTLYMNQWQHIMLDLVNDIVKNLESGIIIDTYDKRLKSSLDNWFKNWNKWELINDSSEK